MTIAIASGKGGAGKTSIATSLAYLLARERRVALLDLDVEEPNAHLYFNVPVSRSEQVSGMIPVVEEQFCSRCGRCQEVCAYHAILVFPSQVLVFPELCKSCRGCVALCPEGAILEGTKSIGVVERREVENLAITSGRLDVGSTEAPALIRAVKERADDSEQLTIIDAPPGTACAAVEAVRHADLTVVVAESTPFGLHDMILAVSMLRELEQNFAVLINKSVAHDTTVHAFCMKEGIRILGEIPQSREIARAGARGMLLPRVLPNFTPLLMTVLEEIMRREEVTS
ncbi:ATP-binding protein [bacterium]|nr:ATP-binding protein [bacterium]